MDVHCIDNSSNRNKRLRQAGKISDDEIDTSMEKRVAHIALWAGDSMAVNCLSLVTYTGLTSVAESLFVGLKAWTKLRHALYYGVAVHTVVAVDFLPSNSSVLS